MVLRGTIGQGHRSPLLDVAKDYYPKVIDMMQTQQTPAGQQASNSGSTSAVHRGGADSLDAQVLELLDEIRAVRADVNRLIELAQENQADKASQ